MLQTNDLILLLTELEEAGDDKAHSLIRDIIGRPSVSLTALKYVNDQRQLDVVSFYEHIRKNNNEKRSPLYKNIVKDMEDPVDVIVTLHAFLLQVALFGRKVPEESKLQFFKHVRAEEVASVLDKYYIDYDVSSALKMIRLIKADLLAFEHINGRRREQ